MRERLLRFTIATHALWFFGNLYEEVVIVPNGLVATSAALAAFNAYFSVTKATLYYVPLTQLGFVGVVWLVFQTRSDAGVEAQSLRRAAAASALAMALTAWIIVHWNLRLWLGDVSTLPDDETRALVREWGLANLLRLALVWGATSWLIRAERRVTWQAVSTS
jgi:hypothetical protein